MEPWQTETVLALAQQMRESKDYSAMPILADALEDAGYDDSSRLSICRSTEMTDIDYCRLLCEVIGGELEKAVEWMEHFSRELDNGTRDDDEYYGHQDLTMNYNKLMTLAQDYLKTGEFITEYGTEHWRDTFNSSDETFWKNYRLIMNDNSPPMYEFGDGSFFNCSC